MLFRLLITLSVCSIVASSALHQENEIKKSTINILNSETLPGNLLPNFLFQQGAIEGALHVQVY